MTDISTPEETSSGATIWRMLRTQGRVLNALLLREMITLYGRTGLGVLWMVIEPLTFALPVLILWSFTRDSRSRGLDLMSFLWSAYMPLLMFRHIGGKALGLIQHNTGLLYHRNVTVMDIAIAIFSVEMIQNIAASAALYLIFFLAGAIQLPADPLMLAVGWFYMGWWCIALATIVASLSVRAPWISVLWQPYSYTYMFYSGVWFLVDWLPTNLQQIALYQPSVQAFEMIRGGLYGNIIVTHFSFTYDTFVLSVMTFIGLTLLRSTRPLVEIH